MTTKVCKDHLELEPVLVENPVGSKHYGTWRCSECDRWLSHAKRPSTVKSIEERQSKIISMILSNDFNEQQLRKLLPLYDVPHLNLVQENLYTEYCMKFLVLVG